MNLTQNKKKIVNDPVYGFITIRSGWLFELIEHPLFQRLRRIKQLGLTDFVYPGAHHSRFHHALGAMHLMQQAIDVLRSKGTEISVHEEESALAAILLHDVGHGPFSHALEHSLIDGVNHESLSLAYMEQLNTIFEGKLSTTIQIFKNTYAKKFLHQLVSSQLDTDRLDYLNRDSFYTGVAEGTIGSDRIIKMLQVVNDELVVEEKGIYSVEKFILARRLMYWQVYLHKTVLAAENVMVQMLRRARNLASQGEPLFCSPALAYFLYADKNSNAGVNNAQLLENFALLDDSDVLCSAKAWINHADKTLAMLSASLVYRKLPKVLISTETIDKTRRENLLQATIEAYQVDEEAAQHFVFCGEVVNSAYNTHEEHIKVLMKTGQVLDIRKASDQLGLPVLSKSVKKYFLCYPKNLKTA